MRTEVSQFLTQTEAAVWLPRLAALHAVRRRVIQDVFGIDCAQDREGRVVVFEVHAAKLVHLPAAAEPVRAAAVARIRGAFDALLAARVARGPVANIDPA